MSDNTSREQRKEFREQQKVLRKQRRKEMKWARKRSGSVMAGMLLLAVGTILLLKEFGVAFPAWLFTWPMILIAFGFFVGAGNSFRDPGWVIISGIGVVFLLDKIWPTIPIYHFIWPVLIIALGLIFIMAPRRHHMWHMKHDRDWSNGRDWNRWSYYDHNTEVNVPPTDVTPVEPVTTSEPKNEKIRGENWLDTVSIFGSIKKTVYSKNFKGGDIVSIFGGAEVNLTQADFKGTMVLEIVQIMGGTKLIVPPHWQIRSEMIAILGGIEDKRAPQANYDTDKVVILNGTTVLGGIEIKSY